MSLLNDNACHFYPKYFSSKCFMQINDDDVGSQSFLYTNLIHILRKLSSLGEEKTVARSSPAQLERQSTAQHLYTIVYFLLLFPSFRFLHLFYSHTNTHTHTHITSHQTNSYTKTHKHENIRISGKHAPGVLLLAL